MQIYDGNDCILKPADIDSSLTLCRENVNWRIVSQKSIYESPLKRVVWVQNKQTLIGKIYCWKIYPKNHQFSQSYKKMF